jgi:probable HAF family extracellular repeat protein
MKLNKTLPIAVMLSFLVITIPADLAAQNTRYKLIDLGTLGGPNSTLEDSPLRALNNQGVVIADSETSTSDPTFPNSCIFCGDPLIFHAFRWQNDHLTDLGAIASTNTSSATWISDSGLIVGFSSDNNLFDRLLGIPQMHATLWKNGQIIDLGTLEGGYESAAQGVNDRGQVVGVSANLVPDPFGPLGTQNRIFLWQSGTMQDLGTLGGPDAGFLGLLGVTVINDRGQVASCSYTNSTANPVTETPTLDPFLWEEGVMRDLGSLGGTSGCAISINNRGQVVGYSNLAGDLTFHPFLWDRAILTDLGTLGGANGLSYQINDRGSVVGRADVTEICTACAPGNQKQLHHPFLWKNGVMFDLGLVNGDTAGTAYSVNSKDQVVGRTVQCAVIGPDDGCDGPVNHAFLWDAGSIFDLQALVAPNESGIVVNDARNINERGEIVGLGVLPSGDVHAVLLVPCNEDGCGNDAKASAKEPAPSYSNRQASVKHSASELQLWHRRIGATP